MFNNKNWSSQQDELIKQVCQKEEGSNQSPNQSNSVCWGMVSKTLKEKLLTIRTSKQCKDRWQNHLQSEKKQKTLDQESYLNQILELQHIYGNKWSYIASILKIKSDIQIKNIFFSHLKKAVRVLNSFLTNNRSNPQFNKYRAFQQNCVFKLIAQEQGKTSKLTSHKDDLSTVARQTKNSMIKILRDPHDHEAVGKIINELHDFNCHCRRLRKKKTRSYDQLNDQESSSDGFSRNGCKLSGKHEIQPVKEKKDDLEKPEIKEEINEQLPVLSKHGTDSDFTRYESSTKVCNSRISSIAEVNYERIDEKQTKLRSISTQSQAVECIYNIEGDIFIPSIFKSNLQTWQHCLGPMLKQERLPIQLLLSIPSLFSPLQNVIYPPKYFDQNVPQRRNQNYFDEGQI